MATYNDSVEYFSTAVDSILSQSLSNFELIIVDDGSNLEYKNFLSVFVSKDKRIRLYSRNENRGLPYSLNEGIKNSKSNFICRMDADDYSHPTRLETQYRFLKNEANIDVVGCQSTDLDSNRFFKLRLPQSHKEIISHSFFNSPFVHPSVMFTRSFIESLNGYDITYLRAQDYHLWARGLVQGCLYHNLDEALFSYRRSGRLRNGDKVNLQLGYTNSVRKMLLEYFFPGIRSDLVNLFLFFSTNRPEHFDTKDIGIAYSELFGMFMSSQVYDISLMRTQILRRLAVNALKHQKFADSTQALWALTRCLN